MAIIIGITILIIGCNLYSTKRGRYLNKKDWMSSKVINQLYHLSRTDLFIGPIHTTMLIGAEGARSSKILSHFLRAVLIQGC
ncbi:hypothetical protein BN000_00071 [Neobacillus massiliamazoniensis]|uniref:Uncharacterized protein n=1 Tax=Neobacillus massiliamazoniensis TaxID=1499688 RepID=A0A0U1NQ79_9BACI|nr:hypothetical protein BN000_00071 [Neobacillus massiliamazoniensis]